MSPVLITFLKQNMERWHANLRFIHKRGMLKPNNLNINKGILYRDSLSHLLFCISLILFSIELKSTNYRDKTTIKNKPFESLQNPVKRFRDDIGNLFCANVTFRKGLQVKKNNIP